MKHWLAVWHNDAEMSTEYSLDVTDGGVFGRVGRQTSVTEYVGRVIENGIDSCNRNENFQSADAAAHQS